MLTRGGAVAARRAHNPKVVGSNPTPATDVRRSRNLPGSPNCLLVSRENMANLLIEALRSSLQRTGLWGSRVVVALSGGPDSLALALGLADLLDEARLTPLVAHFDHRLRSESSDDAAFVARFGETLGWPVSIGSGDVRVIARQERVGLEEAGR